MSTGCTQSTSPLLLAKQAMAQTGAPAWASITGKPATYPATSHSHPTGEVTGLDAALAGKAAASHTHGVADLVAGGVASGLTFLRGDGQWAVPVGGGSDPWTVVKLASDFTTTSATAVNITGLFFTPLANTDYEFYALLYTRTATATVGPRPGVSWPTGMTDGAASVQEPSSATANVFANGNISGAVLAPVGGLPTTTGSWLGTAWGICRAGATPVGNVQLQMASETAGTTVTVKAGSVLRYRSY